MGHGTENDPTGRIDEQRAERLAVTLQAVADPLRLQALTALRRGAHALDQLARELHVEDAKLAGELDRLVDLGLLAQADGTYTLADDHVGSLLDEAVGHDQHREH
jgi:ArsR family transcriptional regulator, nickel/cobalt-responsive transcriptional repressor